MSCYNWERGTIKIPSKDWTAFKKGLRDIYNRIQTQTYEVALRAYDMLMERGKGKRGFNWSRELDELFTNDRLRLPEGVDYYAIKDSMFPYDAEKGGRRSRPLKPKKKNFPLANSSTTVLEVDSDASITFYNKTREVTWNVFENNRAVQHARKHPLGVAFFRALDRIEWTSRTGGVITGNDEYNRESYDVGGGGNYVTAEYGKKLQEEQRKRKTSLGYSVGYLSVGYYARW